MTAHTFGTLATMAGLALLVLPYLVTGWQVAHRDRGFGDG